MTAINTASGFSIRFASGRTHYVHTAGVEGYSEALELARSEGATITEHSGDLSDAGDRTLCWASEDDAHNDDGRRSLCVIVGAYEVTR